MRVATWNINGIRARIDYVSLWLQECQPDLVGFQELKAEDQQFPLQRFQELGYEVVTHGQKSWNGVAIASKKPMRVAQVGLPGQEDNGSRLLTVETEGLSFTTVYCPNGKDTDHPDFNMKLAWFDSLSDYWDRMDPNRAIICGDFNVVPQAMDSWRGEAGEGSIFHTSEERCRLSRLMDAGLIDIYRVTNPDSDAYSWWDYRAMGFQQNHGLRIDLILGTKSVLSGTQSAVIHRDYRKKKEGLTASDHAPVYVDIQ